MSLALEMKREIKEQAMTAPYREDYLDWLKNRLMSMSHTALYPDSEMWEQRYKSPVPSFRYEHILAQIAIDEGFFVHCGSVYLFPERTQVIQFTKSFNNSHNNNHF